MRLPRLPVTYRSASPVNEEVNIHSFLELSCITVDRIQCFSPPSSPDPLISLPRWNSCPTCGIFARHRTRRDSGSPLAKLLESAYCRGGGGWGGRVSRMERRDVARGQLPTFHQDRCISLAPGGETGTAVSFGMRISLPALCRYIRPDTASKCDFKADDVAVFRHPSTTPTTYPGIVIRRPPGSTVGSGVGRSSSTTTATRTPHREVHVGRSIFHGWLFPEAVWRRRPQEEQQAAQRRAGVRHSASLHTLARHQGHPQ